MEEVEEPLAGGAVSGPVRVGDTVRRPPASAEVHRVLRHLELVGFDGAPRLLGTDEKGRDVLTYIPGTVPIGPSFEDAALVSAARLIRRYHKSVGTGADGTTICHNDLAPRNTIFQGTTAVALVDWDFVVTAPPLWDVAHAVWQFVFFPFGTPSAEPARHLQLFLDAYELPAADRADLLPTVVTRMHSSADGIDRRAKAGEHAFVRLAAEGVAETIRAEAEWVTYWKP